MYGRHNLSIIMHSDISHTTINMFFFKTYTCFIWSEIAIRKGSTTCNVDCSTLQTSRPNHPTIYTYTCTNTHTNNSQSMHSCIYAFIHSTIFTLSLFHKNEPSITTAIHHNHPSIINHALHVPLRMAFVHARITLPWLAHNEIKCICMHTACLGNHHLTEIHTYTHTCIEMTTSSHPLNVLMSIFGVVVVGGGGDIDHRVGTAARLLLRVDSWMTDLKAMMVMRICVMIGRRMTYMLYTCTRKAIEQPGQSRKISEIKTDRRSQETITVNR